MPKNIVIFSDGTGQDGGSEHNSNVYKLFNLILDRSSRQVSFYDKGLGTGWRKATGNIGGRGFGKNVRECYRFIFDNYREDDHIFLFGFSRGAATIRSLAGFLHLFGILPKSRGQLIEKAWKIYKTKNKDRRKNKADNFIKNNHTMWVNVDFMGVWDTVAALGLPNTRLDHVIDRFIPHGFHDFDLSESVTHAYHALAIDDVRRSFHPVFFHPPATNEQTLRQVWFMGMHTDVGGGYDETELSDIVLEWMVQHAVKHGLHIYHNKKRKPGLCTPNPKGLMHDSRDKLWKKFVFPAETRFWKEKFGEAVIHESVQLRNGLGVEYNPWILEHNPKVDAWTHLEDWKNDPRFADAKAMGNLEALEGWCVPRRPDRD